MCIYTHMYVRAFLVSGVRLRRPWHLQLRLFSTEGNPFGSQAGFQFKPFSEVADFDSASSSALGTHQETELKVWAFKAWSLGLR